MIYDFDNQETNGGLGPTYCRMCKKRTTQPKGRGRKRHYCNERCRLQYFRMKERLGFIFDQMDMFNDLNKEDDSGQ